MNGGTGAGTSTRKLNSKKNQAMIECMTSKIVLSCIFTFVIDPKLIFLEYSKEISNCHSDTLKLFTKNHRNSTSDLQSHKHPFIRRPLSRHLLDPKVPKKASPWLAENGGLAGALSEVYTRSHWFRANILDLSPNYDLIQSWRIFIFIFLKATYRISAVG